MHLNIYSLKNKVDRLQVFLEKEKPNIVCITEHHLKDQERKIINWENFYEGSIYCRKVKTKGGTAIYVNTSTKSKEVNVLDLVSERNIELCAIKCSEEKVAVACVYRPPSGNHGIFFKNLEKLFSRLCKDNRTVFISGDFNINLAPTKKNKQEKLYADRLVKLLELYNLKPTIKSPSRQTRKTATLIDNIFTNSTDDNVVCIQ